MLQFTEAAWFPYQAGSIRGLRAAGLVHNAYALLPHHTGSIRGRRAREFTRLPGGFHTTLVRLEGHADNDHRAVHRGVSTPHWFD